MGYCVVHIQGHQITMHEMDVLKLNAKLDNYTRLRLIYNKVEELISTYKPHCFAIEAPFFGKNVQSMLKLGRAQGVAIAAAIGAGVEVCEYSPRKIKQSITGNGNADKEQVWKMLQQILLIKQSSIKYFDASDALAVAVCHQFQMTSPLQDKRGKAERKAKSSWENFVINNPDRVK